MDGYYLRGVDDEFILVLRGFDHVKILEAVERLATGRDEISKLAIQLKEEFYEQYGNGDNPIITKQDHQRQGSTRKRNKPRKA